MGEKLSPTQVRALQLAAQDPNLELHRWPGGYWTFAGCKAKGVSWPQGDPIPEGYVAVQTLYALERKGILHAHACNMFGEPSRFRLTKAGRAALASPAQQEKQEVSPSQSQRCGVAPSELTGPDNQHSDGEG